MFVRAFDSKGNHKLDVNEFVTLHQFLSTVSDAFAAAARGARSISAADAQQALGRMGYTLDPAAMQATLLRHDVEARGAFARDDFLRMCLFLHTGRRAFSAFDSARTGKMEVSFNQFVYAASYLA